MDLEIPLTKNEEKLIDEFCKEIKGKIEENEREYKTKISKQESIENWTEGALERIKSVVDKYLGKGIKLNSRCNSSEETVVNLIFNEIEVKLDESSEEVFEKLKKSGLSLGGKSVLEAIQDGNFERNRNITTSVIEQPNAATNTPQSYLENIFLNGHNDRTKRIDSRHG